MQGLAEDEYGKVKRLVSLWASKARVRFKALHCRQLSFVEAGFMVLVFLNVSLCVKHKLEIEEDQMQLA